MTEFIREDSETFRLAEDALRVSLFAQAQAQTSDEWPREPSGILQALISHDARFASWPDALNRAHEVGHIARGFYGKYWRVNLRIAGFPLNPALSADERAEVQTLHEMIVWSRVRLEPIGNTSYPQAPSVQGVNQEFLKLFGELGSPPESPYVLPHTTWAGTVSALVNGRTTFGVRQR